VKETPVVKVIGLVGSSTVHWEDAAKNAVAEAAKTARNITGVDMTRQTAVVENNAKD